MPRQPDRRQLVAAYQTAQRLQAAGRDEEALKAYRALLAVSPGIPEAHFQIGRVLLGLGRLTDARAATEQALKLKPGEEAIWALMVDIARAGGAPAPVLARARKAGLSDDAMKRLEARAAAAPPRRGEPPVPEAAERLVRRAGEAARRGDDAEARRLYDRALSKAPGTAPILIRRAETLMTLGELEAAAADALGAVEAAPEIGGYWRVWARVRKVKSDDPRLADLERHHRAAPEGGEDRRQMAFALAKAMEDVGAYDRVFGYLNEANALTAKRFPYNFAADVETARRLRRAYTPELVTRWSGGGCSDAAPIYVTGMPRSGTTLVEQIIASHSAVTGGGELGLLFKPIEAVVGRVLSEGVAAGEGFAEAGRAYAAELSRRFPSAARVTDKSIATYAMLGFVPLALPRAKIVVVRRDPRDSCLSVLKTQFADGQHRYSYAMETTAAFYRLFAEQVAFWREAAPAAFIEVWYEDVVRDPEREARRLLDFCGLDWEDGVLAFHENARAVKTLSTAQVRQPLYASSVGAWKRYEKDLAPLLAALGPVAERA